MTNKQLIEGLVATAKLNYGNPAMLFSETEERLMAAVAEAAIEFMDSRVELAFRTAFADGMERAVGIFQRQAPPSVEESWTKFKESL